MTRIVHWFFLWKMDPISGCDICLVFRLPPRDSTLEYERCVNIWNNYLYILILLLTPRRKHKTDVWAWHGIHLSHKKPMKYSGRRKLLCELSKLSNLMLLTSSDTKRTLMHLFLFTNSAEKELVSICKLEYTRPQLTFLSSVPWCW